MKSLLAVAALFISTASFASTINMHDNGVLMNSQGVEMVVVQGNDLYLRTYPLPCPNLPNGATAEVYECYTTREVMSRQLNDTNILMLQDSDLSKYIVALGQTFDCANRSTPSVVNYKGANVYWFSGLLFSKSH